MQLTIFPCIGLQKSIKQKERFVITHNEKDLLLLGRVGDGTNQLQCLLLQCLSQGLGEILTVVVYDHDLIM